MVLVFIRIILSKILGYVYLFVIFSRAYLESSTLSIQSVDEIFEFDHGFDTRDIITSLGTWMSRGPWAQGCLGIYLPLFIFLNHPASQKVAILVRSEK